MAAFLSNPGESGSPAYKQIHVDRFKKHFFTFDNFDAAYPIQEGAILNQNPSKLSITWLGIWPCRSFGIRSRTHVPHVV
jgi:hypothetical protein